MTAGTPRPARYHLACDGHPVADGPLALVGIQAAALAAAGRVATVADPTGAVCAVYLTPAGALRAEWQAPLVFFPDPAETGPPGWLTRLCDLLQEGDQP